MLGSGYLATMEGATIALCGGWEMSQTCRRGPRDGELHQVDWLRPGVDHHYWCEYCVMPLHPIGPGSDFQLMSIERHIINEEPW